MKKLIRHVALSAAIAAGSIAGTNYLLAYEKAAKLTPEDIKRLQIEKPLRGGINLDGLSDDALWGLIRFNMTDEKPRVAVEPPVKVLPSEPPPVFGRGFEPATPGGAAGDSKPDAKIEPVKVGDTIAKTDFAVKPKELSAQVKKGLEYLVKGQQEDGGWNQGGGWRNNSGGRVEGKTVEDPSDIGNTCFVLLALVRAGNTATEGEYKDAVKKGLKFVISKVEKADKDSLYVTDVKGTQLQSKIGQYVDTFLVNLVLAEYRGKSGDQEKALVAALEKTMTKIVRHQTADGGFAGNAGWAPTLSVGIANKSLVRARERGAKVDDDALKRVMAQAKGAATGTAPAAVPPGAGGAAATEPARLAGAAGDAGVMLYRSSQGAGNTQDFLNTLRLDATKAREVLKDANAPKEAKQKAEQKLNDLQKAEDENDKVQGELAKNVRNESFVAGFGNNGGEEFLSFMNISETLVLIGGKDWADWDAKMVKGLEKAQDKDGSWQGHHCITGKTFCTAGALLVLMADRTPFPVDVIKAAKEKREKKPEPEPKK
jgi:prenyltransferase/squalene oxidase-like repeat protein